MSQLLKFVNKLFSHSVSANKSAKNLARHYDYDGAYLGIAKQESPIY